MTENLLNIMCIRKDVTVKEAMRKIGENTGKVLYVLEDGGLFGSLSDGDIRKWILNEGKLSEFVRIVNGSGKFILNGNNYPINILNSKLEINSSLYLQNESFFIESMKVDFSNLTESSANLLVNIFTGEDITAVFTDAQNSRIVQVQNGYEFSFSIPIICALGTMTSRTCISATCKIRCIIPNISELNMPRFSASRNTSINCS